MNEIAGESYPKSANVWRCDAKDYWITAALWDTGYGPSYEIGIRKKTDRQEFWLLQGGWREDNVKKAAEAVKNLLDMHWAPSEIQEIFP